MVQQFDVEKAARLLDLIRVLNVGSAWSGIARGVVMAQDDGPGVADQCSFENGPRVDRGECQGAFGEHLAIDDPVLAVEVERPELLVVEFVEVVAQEMGCLRTSADLDGIVHMAVLNLKSSYVQKPLRCV